MPSSQMTDFVSLPETMSSQNTCNDSTLFTQDSKVHSDVYGLIVAAGKGSRFRANTPKQYTIINGKTVLSYSIEALAASDYINHIQLVIAADDTQAATLSVSIPVYMAIGGAERWQSVKAGVAAIVKRGAKPTDLVVIHDAARPCVATEHVNAVIETADKTRYGAILGVPVADTLKQIKTVVNPSNSSEIDVNQKTGTHSKISHQVVKTIKRDNLWQAQTPQVFRLGVLQEVLEEVGTKKMSITDEASAFEIIGYEIEMVEGSSQNIKLTYSDDLAFIKALLAITQNNI